MPTATDLRTNGPTGTGTGAGVTAGAEVIAPSRFAQAIASGKVVVEFFNYGCPHCRAALPEVHKAANTLAAKGVKIYMISLGDDAGRSLGGQYAPGYLPGFAVFENGRHVGSFNRGANEVDSAFVRGGVSRLLNIS